VKYLIVIGGKMNLKKETMGENLFYEFKI